MLRCLMRGATRAGKSIARAVTALAKHLAQRLCREWKLHGQWVATDAVYAAVTATVMAGLLGLVPGHRRRVRGPAGGVRRPHEPSAAPAR